MKTPNSAISRFTGITFLATSVALASIAGAQEGQLGYAELRVQGQQDVENILNNWEAAPAQKARELIQEYGQPNEVTERRLIWHNNGVWKRTEIVNEEVAHNFPQPHQDFLYQTINYNVPEEKAGEIIQMSGSLIIDRVKGELTARCDSEEANLLAINLAHQIVEEKKNAKSGRDTYAEAMMEEKHQDMMERLLFSPEQIEDPADPGIIYGARAEQTEEVTEEVSEEAESAARRVLQWRQQLETQREQRAREAERN
jgi:hypothetical protein